MKPSLRLAAVLAATWLANISGAQVSVVSSYHQDFNAIGTALPDGWGVWMSSTATGNGSAFPWSVAEVPNNGVAVAASYFRNLPGASQTWSAGLSGGTDRAIGWRAGNAASRDGSITFTLINTTDWTLDSLSFQLFTPNDSGTAGTFQLEYQIGTGSFTPFTGVSYTNDTARNPLTVTSIALSALPLSVINHQNEQVTLRLANTATAGTSWNTLAIDNFAYTATRSSVPEPATYAALAGAAALLGAVMVRQRRRRPAVTD